MSLQQRSLLLQTQVSRRKLKMVNDIREASALQQETALLLPSQCHSRRDSEWTALSRFKLLFLHG